MTTLLLLAASVAAAAQSLPSQPSKTEAAGEAAAPSGSGSKPAASPDAEAATITRQGLNIAFAVKPLVDGAEQPGAPIEQQHARLSFKITDGAKGEPVRSLTPGVWIDMINDGSGKASTALSCKDRVGSYLGGRVGITPLIDVNSYFILSMNQDSTISVIDPNVVIGGTSNVLYGQISLSRPGEDWLLDKDGRYLFVTMPRADGVAVVEMENFKLVREITTGREPMRIAIQPDGRFIWVAYNAKGETGGVTVIDAASLEVKATIETGKGHHEIAFSDDDRVALITNRADGNVAVVDVARRKVINKIAVGKAPVSVAYSSSAKAFYVADGESGAITVIDGRNLKNAGQIKAQRGLGPMRATADGRWLLIVNPSADLVRVIDTSAATVAHDVPIKGRPYQVALTRAFAYVRTLDSGGVSMINLSFFGKDGTPAVTSFPVGEAPSKAGRLAIADSVVPAAGEAGVVAVDPAAGTIVYYMEGMTSPMGSFKAMSGRPKSVLVVDRFLRESAPGNYTADVILPHPGTYEAAFVLDSPSVLHCFTFDVKADRALVKHKGLQVQHLSETTAPVGQPVAFRFRLVDADTEKPRDGVGDLQVLYYRAPGLDRKVVAATGQGDGVYAADLTFAKPGAYYVYVLSPSAQLAAHDRPFLTMQAFARAAASAPTVADGATPPATGHKE
jgi:YVTN family beta-propeller protein